MNETLVGGTAVVLAVAFGALLLLFARRQPALTTGQIVGLVVLWLGTTGVGVTLITRTVSAVDATRADVAEIRAKLAQDAAATAPDGGAPATCTMEATAAEDPGAVEDCREETDTNRSAAKTRVSRIIAKIEGMARYFAGQPALAGHGTLPPPTHPVQKTYTHCVPQIVACAADYPCCIQKSTKEVIVSQKIGNGWPQTLGTVRYGFDRFTIEEQYGRRDGGAGPAFDDNQSYYFFSQRLFPLQYDDVETEHYLFPSVEEKPTIKAFGLRLIAIMNSDSATARTLGPWALAAAARSLPPVQHNSAMIRVRDLYNAASSNIAALDAEVAGLPEQKYAYSEHGNYVGGMVMRRWREVRDGTKGDAEAKLAAANDMLLRLRFWCVEASSAFKMPEHRPWATALLPAMQAGTVAEKGWYLGRLDAIQRQP